MILGFSALIRIHRSHLHIHVTRHRFSDLKEDRVYSQNMTTTYVVSVSGIPLHNTSTCNTFLTIYTQLDIHHKSIVFNGDFIILLSFCWTIVRFSLYAWDLADVLTFATVPVYISFTFYSHTCTCCEQYTEKYQIIIK